jgi:hypothetical protein
MPSQTLDLSNVINISILSTSAGLGLPNINTAAVFTKDVPSWNTAFKIYTNATDVATDFGSSSNAAKIASAFFAQQPNPLGTNGYLVYITLASGGAEFVETAIARTLNSVYYFGVLVDQILTGARLAALATYMQSIDKVLFYASATQADYAPGGMLDLLRSGGETHSRGLYYSDGTAIDTQLMASAYAGRALSTDFSGSNTTQTMHLKTLATVVPDQTVDQTNLVAAQTAGVDVYVSIAGVSGLFTSGKNAFFDEVYNEFWLKFALQTSGFNFLKQTNTKIPQTETGMESLKNVYRKVLDQGIRNGFMGPGSWTSSTVFGDPASLIRNIADIGYYVFSAPITQQLDADRQARKAPVIQIAAKTQGAIHSSNVIVNVNL